MTDTDRLQLLFQSISTTIGVTKDEMVTASMLYPETVIATNILYQLKLSRFNQMTNEEFMRNTGVSLRKCVGRDATVLEELLLNLCIEKYDVFAAEWNYLNSGSEEMTLKKLAS
mgnify:FL=1